MRSLSIKYAWTPTAIPFWKRCVNMGLALLLALEPLPLYAASAELRAAAKQQAQTQIFTSRPTRSENAAAIIPVKNPNAPDASGNSLNKTPTFDVGVEGMVVNNSLVAGLSALGRAVAANPNYEGRSAKRIIYQVMTSDTSDLLGPLEIFGDRADFLLINPYGIECKGCGFINTANAILSTEDFASGVVKGGSVNFSNAEEGKPAAQTSGNLTVRAQKIHIDGAIQAKGMLALEAQAQKETTGEIAIDASELGAMTAGNIEIIANGAGAGVRLAGGASALDWDTLGTGMQKNTNPHSITVKAEGKLQVNGNALYAEDAINLDAGALEAENLAVVTEKGTITHRATESSFWNNVMLSSGDGVKILAPQLLLYQSVWESLGDQRVQAGNMVAIESGMDSQAGTIGIVAEKLQDQSALVTAQKGIEIATTGAWQTLASRWHSEGAFTAVGSWLEAVLSSVSAKEDMVLASTQGDLATMSAIVSAGQNLALLSSGHSMHWDLQADAGNSMSLISGGDTELERGVLKGAVIQLATPGDIRSSAEQKIDARTLEIMANHVTQEGGWQAQNIAMIIADTLENTGRIEATKGARIVAGNEINNRGRVASTGTNEWSAATIQNAGELEASILALTADQIENRGKTNATRMDLFAGERITNRGTLHAEEELKIASNQMINAESGEMKGKNLSFTLALDFLNLGHIASEDTTEILAGKNIQNHGAMNAKGVMNLASDRIENAGSIESEQGIGVGGNRWENSSIVKSAKGLAVAVTEWLNTGDVTVREGIIASERVTNEGQIRFGQSAILEASESMTNTGSLNAGETLAMASNQWSNEGEINALDLLVQAKTIRNHEEMHADRVAITGDEITNRGAILAKENLDVLANITMQNQGQMNAGAFLNLISDRIENSGTINAAQGIGLSANNWENQGSLVSAQALAMAVAEIQNTGMIKASEGRIAAGTITNDGQMQFGKNLMAVVSGEFKNRADIKADEIIAIKADRIANLQGGRVEGSDLSLETITEIENTGALLAKKGAQLKGGAHIQNIGTIEVNRGLGLAATTPENNGMRKESLLSMEAKDIRNEGTISADAMALVASGMLDQRGTLEATKLAALEASDVWLSGHVRAASSEWIAKDRLRATGETTIGQDLRIAGKHIELSGPIEAGGMISIAATENVQNTGTLAAQSIHALTEKFLDQQGILRASNDVMLVSAHNITQSGVIESEGNLVFDAETVQHTGMSRAKDLLWISRLMGENKGALNTEALSFSTKGSFSNEGSVKTLNALTYTGLDGESLGAAFLNKASGTIDAGSLVVGANRIENAGTLSVKGESHVESGDAITNAGSMELIGPATLIARGTISGSGITHFVEDAKIKAATLIDYAVSAQKDLLVEAEHFVNGKSQSVLGTYAMRVQDFTNTGTIQIGKDWALNDGVHTSETSALKLLNRGNITVGGVAAFDGETFRNEGTMRAGSFLTSAGKNTFINTGTLIADGDYTINTPGLAQNLGRIEVNGLLTILADTIENRALWSAYGPGMAQMSHTGELIANAIALSATGHISNLDGGSIISKVGDVVLEAGQGITERGIKIFTGAGGNRDGFRFAPSVIQSAQDVTLKASGGDITLQGSDVSAARNLSLIAKNNILLPALTGSYYERSDATGAYCSSRRFTGGCRNWVTTYSDVYTNTVENSDLNAGGSIIKNAQTGSIVMGGAHIQAGGDIIATAANDIIAQSVMLGSPAFNSGFSYDGTALLAGGNVTLSAGRDIINRASSIAATGTLDAHASGNIVNEAQAGSYISKEVHSKRYTEIRKEIVMQNAEMIAGNDLFLTAGGDIQNTGSTLSASNNAYLVAGGDIALKAQTESVDQYLAQSKSRLTSKSSTQSGWSESQTLLSNIAAGGDALLSAGGAITGVGARISAGNDLVATAGGDISFAAEQVKNYQWMSGKTSGFALFGLFGAAIDSANGKGDIASNVVKQVPLLNAVNELGKIQGPLDAAPWMKMGTEIYQTREQFRALIDAGKTTASALGDIGLQQAGVNLVGGIPVPSSLGFYTQSFFSRSDWTTSHPSELSAGRDASLSAENVSLLGSLLLADRDTRITALNDLVVASVQDSFASQSKQSSNSFSISFSNTGEGSVGVNASHSEQKSNASGITQVPSRIESGGTLSLNVGGDLNVVSSSLSADTVNATVEGATNIITQQDTFDSKTRGSSFGAGVNVGFNGVIIPQASIGGMKADAHSALSNKIAQIVAKRTLTLLTKDLTLRGGTLAALEPNGIDITTNSLEFSDNHDIETKSASSWSLESGNLVQIATNAQGATAPISVGANKSDILGVVSGASSSSLKEGLTKATITSGSITIQGQAASDAQLAGLNRDLSARQIITRREQSVMSAAIPLSEGLGTIPTKGNGGGVYMALANDRTYVQKEGQPMTIEQILDPKNGLSLKGAVTEFFNGIFNSYDDALRNASQQLGTKYDNKTIIAYNPSHGFLGDLVEVGYNLLTTAIPLLPYTGDVRDDIAFFGAQIDANPDASIFAASHSGGGVFKNLMLKNAPVEAILENKISLTTQFSGVPLSNDVIRRTAEEARVERTYIQINNSDFVPNILGFNAQNTNEVVESFAKFPNLFGDDSPHSHYPSAISGERRPDTRLIIYDGISQ